MADSRSRGPGRANGRASGRPASKAARTSARDGNWTAGAIVNPARAAAPEATQSVKREGTRLRTPKITGRAAVLVLVLAVLTVSYASSLKAYLQQRSHISDLKSQIAQSEADIADLETEKERWHDPAFLAIQARSRFGYVLPGETSYVVLGADGKPLEPQTTFAPRNSVSDKQPTAWWSTAWRSVELAGNPPAAEPKPKPLEQIGGKASQ